MTGRIALGFGLLLVSTVSADKEQGGTQSPFGFGAGARELAMGSSPIASCDPTVAPFWNPSRLATADHMAIAGFYTHLYGNDVSYQYLGLAWPTLDYGSLGIGIFRLGVGGIEKRDESNFRTGTFDESRLGLYFGYARKISSYDVGLAVSFEHQSLAGYSATSSPGLHLSAGRTVSLSPGLFRQVAIAVNLRNVIAPSTKLLDASVEYPFAADISAALQLTPDAGGSHAVLLTTSVSKYEGISPIADAGFEYSYADVVTLQAGMKEGDITVGGGVQYGSFGLNYALVERPLGSTHLFSLTTSIGSSVENRRHERSEKREAAFQRAMTEQLVSRNRELAGNYLREGKAYFAKGELDSSISALDRALFLARSSNSDTSEVVSLLSESRLTLETIENRARVSEYVDSAQADLIDGLPLQAQYFARLALQLDSSSATAAELLRKSSAAINDAQSHELFIAERLVDIDSLLTYGHIDAAAQIMQSLTATAGTNQLLSQTARRIQFERYIRQAESHVEQRVYTQGRIYADSALIIYPGNDRSLQLRKTCIEMLKSQSKAAGATVAAAAPSTELSAAVRHEVEESYVKGQQAFKEGNLSRAVVYWEKVDRLSPTYKQVREYLLNCYKYLGIEVYSKNQLREALDFWSKAAALDPSNTEITTYLTRVKNELHKLKALSYDPD